MPCCTAEPRVGMAAVFRIFLRLGLTSFGGPIAHLGYFRREFVERRAWLTADAFTDLVAFCSVLPGPTSSQVGMLIGLTRAGPGGALAAWIGFTGPSAVIMTCVALGLRALNARHGVTESAWFNGLLAGLTAAAAAVVAQAVLALTRAICTEPRTQTIALGSAVVAVAIGAAGLTGFVWVPIVLGALAGLAFLRAQHLNIVAVSGFTFRVSHAAAVGGVLVFLLAMTVYVVPVTPAVQVLQDIVRAGALVFGGGHVVLPLLQALVDQHLMAQRDFFAGYGVVQAMPGPLNTFSAFVGAANGSALSGIPGALVGLIAIFVPSFALIFALAPAWNRVRSLPGAAAALRGANASVVGLLGAVLFRPILPQLMQHADAIGIALVAYALIDVWKLPPWTIVVGGALAGAATGALL